MTLQEALGCVKGGKHVCCRLLMPLTWSLGILWRAHSSFLTHLEDDSPHGLAKEGLQFALNSPDDQLGREPSLSMILHQNLVAQGMERRGIDPNDPSLCQPVFELIGSLLREADCQYAPGRDSLPIQQE